MEVSDILSLIAIVISSVLAVITTHQAHIMNRLNIEAECFRDVYRKHLLVGLPDARRYLVFNEDNTLTGTEKICTELHEVIKDYLCYKYLDNGTFYNQLKKITNDMEDYVLNAVNRKMDKENQNEFYNELSERMEILYK